MLTETSLTYYDAKTTKEKGSIQMATTTSAHLKKDDAKLFFVNAMKRQYLFRCGAAEEARAWVDAVQSIIAKYGGDSSSAAGGASFDTFDSGGSSTRSGRSLSDVLPPDFVLESSATPDLLERRGYLLVGGAGTFAQRDWRWVVVEGTVLSIFATPDAVLRGDAPLRECPLLGAEWWIDGGVDGTIDEEAGEAIVNALDAAATDAGDADGGLSSGCTSPRESRAPGQSVLTAGAKGSLRLSVLGAAEASAGVHRRDESDDVVAVSVSTSSFDDDDPTSPTMRASSRPQNGIISFSCVSNAHGRVELGRWGDTIMLACSLARLCAELNSVDSEATMSAAAAAAAHASHGATVGERIACFCRVVNPSDADATSVAAATGAGAAEVANDAPVGGAGSRVSLPFEFPGVPSDSAAGGVDTAEMDDMVNIAVSPIEGRNAAGHTLLFCASKSGNFAVVEQLMTLDPAAQPNVRCGLLKECALHVATRRNHSEGADINMIYIIIFHCITYPV